MPMNPYNGYSDNDSNEPSVNEIMSLMLVEKSLMSLIECQKSFSDIKEQINKLRQIHTDTISGEIYDEIERLCVEQLPKT